MQDVKSVSTRDNKGAPETRRTLQGELQAGGRLRHVFVMVRSDGGPLRREQRGPAGIWNDDEPCARLAEHEARGRMVPWGGGGSRGGLR